MISPHTGDPSLSVSDRADWLVFGLTERSNADLMILDRLAVR